MMDALVPTGEEGRDQATISCGEPLIGYDPQISEWGNPFRLIPVHLRVNT